MVTINCLASGSTGNCYLVNLGSGWVILDAGIPISEITKNVNLNNILFGFISHNHTDHSKSAEKLVLRGIYLLRGNLIEETQEISLERLKQANLRVLAFPLKHGNEKNGGIIIFNTQNKECLLYAIDFNICEPDIGAWLDYFIPGTKLTHIMVECNYVEELIANKTGYKEKKQIRAHMGLNGLTKFLDTLDLENCQEVILMHTSQGYGDPIVMASTIYSKYRIRTGICKRFGGIEYYG